MSPIHESELPVNPERDLLKSPKGENSNDVSGIHESELPAIPEGEIFDIFREVVAQPTDAKTILILKRIGCRKQGFPERELPRFRKEASILRTETFGPHSEQLGHNLWVHDKKRVETHARRLGTEDTETHAEGLRSSAGAQENSLPHSSCPKTLTQKRLTKNSSLQQKLSWRCTRPQLFQHGSFAWCQILEQPVATLM